ncbi:MAG: hypothetical protein MUF54_19625, partial [Polyangiaceae bacterium]|nr:hypothetical protein [Polyangiaceae bacterium]
MSFRSWLIYPLLLAAACAPLGCAYNASEPVTEQTGSTADSITATSNALTLKLSNRASWQQRNGKRVVVLKGRANQDVVEIVGWVPDDAFGQVTMLSTRDFEIVLDGGHELNTLLRGLPLYLRISPASSPTSFLHAMFRMAPVFGSFQGTSRLWIASEVRPVYALGDPDDPLRYRGSASSTVDLDSLTVSADDGGDPAAHRVDARHYFFDWQYEPLALASDPPRDPVYFSAETHAGPTLSKQARLYLQVTDLQVSAEDPWKVWPPLSCKASTYECIQQTPADAADLSACGDFREVAVCMNAEDCSGYGTVPLALAPLDIENEVGAALQSYNSECDRGGTWCAASAKGYTVPQCAQPPATIQQVVALLQQQDPAMLSDGAYVGRDGLASSPFFNSGYSNGGPALLLAL